MCRPERVRDVPCGSASSPTWERTPQSRTVVGLRADQSVLAGFVTRRLRHGACPLVARRQTWEAPRRDRAHRSTDVRSRSQVRRCQRRVTDSTAVFREAGAHPGARRHPALLRRRPLHRAKRQRADGTTARGWIGTTSAIEGSDMCGTAPPGATRCRSGVQEGSPAGRSSRWGARYLK